MSSLTVRITETSHRMLQELAEQSGESMQSVLDKALEQYRRQRFLEAANADYAALRRDPEAWKEELEERKLWDQALSDGLEGA